MPPGNLCRYTWNTCSCSVKPFGILRRTSGHHTGAVVTGAAAAHLSEMTGGAAAVIPEVLAGQVLSLAHRGGGHTVIAASGAGGTALDRLVVTLEPLGVDDDEAGKRAEERSRPHGDSDSSQRGRADDHRSRYALVVRCAPGQVKQS